MPDLEFNEKEILIDKERKNACLKGWDSEEYDIFLRHKKNVNPIYLEDDIIYEFNQEGYRTKEIKNLDKQFVLVFGCSHTEGVGNFEEHIWCSQLLNPKGIDFLNLGKAGTGPDIQYFNSLQWIKNAYPVPSLVIYQWPQTFRKSFAYEKSNSVVFKHYNVTTKYQKKDTDWFLKRYCIEKGEMIANNYNCYFSANMLWQHVGVPVLNWTWEGDFDRQYQDLHIIDTIDTGRARDLMHDGPDIHRQVADKLSPLVDKLL